MFRIVLEQQKCSLILTTAVFYSFIPPTIDAAQNVKIFKKQLNKTISNQTKKTQNTPPHKNPLTKPQLGFR